MDLIPNPVRIKDLLIFQNDEIIDIIRKDIEFAQNHNVYIGELFINRFIYEERSTDLSILRIYLKMLNAIIKVFNDIYSDEIYTLRLEGLITDKEYLEIYNNNVFHQIFHDMNNEFNTFIFDSYVFDDFLIFYSETSLGVILQLYQTFNQTIVSLLSPYVDRNILISINAQRTVRFFPFIYDKIFEQLDDAALPFY